MNDQDIQIDVDAEKQVFAPALTPSSIKMDTESVAQMDVPLPPSIPYTPTQVDIKSAPQAEVSKTALNMSLKFNAEDHYNELRETVDSLQSQIKNNSNEMRTQWIPDAKPENKFEEKPTVDPTNLIFLQRREQFSKFPHWA
jgi:hypothetical protein